MGIKPGPKRIAKSTGKPDRRQRDNKETPGNTPSLKPHIHKKGDWVTLKSMRSVSCIRMRFRFIIHFCLAPSQTLLTTLKIDFVMMRSVITENRSCITAKRIFRAEKWLCNGASAPFHTFAPWDTHFQNQLGSTDSILKSFRGWWDYILLLRKHLELEPWFPFLI